MKLFAQRLWYTLLWIIALAIIIPISAIAFPVILLIKTPSSFMDKWPRKILPPKKIRIQPFVPVADSIFSQN